MATAQFTPFDEQLRRQTCNVYQTLSEKDRRRFAAVLARQLGRGGIAYVAKVLGCSTRTITRGIKELDSLPEEDVSGRIRRPGAGRKKKSLRKRTWKSS